MTRFREMTADETLAALAALRPGPRNKAARGLLFTRSNRPREITQQLRLLEALANTKELTPTERSYALIGAAHKASEALDREALMRLLPSLDAAFTRALTLPSHRNLRRDGVHLRFSLLNVLTNAALLLDPGSFEQRATQTIAAFDALTPRQAQPALFKSSANMFKTLGLAMLAFPEDIARRLPQLGAMLELAAELHFSRRPLHYLRRSRLPESFAGMAPHGSLNEFEDTLIRLRAFRAVAAASPGAKRQDALHEVAALCVAQLTPAQHEAHVQAATRFMQDRALA